MCVLLKHLSVFIIDTLKAPLVSLLTQVNPYEPEAEWYTKDREIHPLSSAPEPKRRFIPSKWEEKR